MAAYVLKVTNINNEFFYFSLCEYAQITFLNVKWNPDEYTKTEMQTNYVMFRAHTPLNSYFFYKKTFFVILF